MVSQISVRESQKSSSLRGDNDRISGEDERTPKNIDMGKYRKLSQRSKKLTQPINENDNDIEKDQAKGETIDT